MEIHVSKTGHDSNPGTEESPFFTISKAAGVSQPGDLVIVHEGTYREWVDPRYGGTSELERITYQAAAGEEVIISGSEVVDSWERVESDVWKSTVPRSMFGEFNPYEELLFGDWFISQGRDHHPGEVFLNGNALFEVETRDKVMNPEPWDLALDKDASLYTWFCELERDVVVFYANFRGHDPNEELAEISVRPACFYPTNNGINFIAVRGFTMCQAATPWAPPTAEQMGIIGPHWSKGWLIEYNTIYGAKCTGISLGKERGTGENEWARLWVKSGAQRQREVVFRALQLGWSRDTVGSHTVRNNTIRDCGMAGICGHLGAIFSTISGNHIYNIHARDMWSGHEMGGIKIHAAIDMLIADNHIHHCTKGLWLDWEAQGVRVTGNVFYENRWEDLFVEISHGPYVIDNNVLLSPLAIRNVSQGGTYAHNLVGGKILVRNVPNRFTPYHFPHSTSVAGVMTILSGDDRYYNNIFCMASDKEPQRQKINAPGWIYDVENTAKAWQGESLGLSVYDEFPKSTDEWERVTSVQTYAVKKLPVTAESNVYYQGSVPWAKETNPVARPDFNPGILLHADSDRVMVQLTVDDALDSSSCPPISTEILGTAFQSEVPFKNPDGTRLLIDRDIVGTDRGSNPTAGPFQGLSAGSHEIVVWPVDQRSFDV